MGIAYRIDKQAGLTLVVWHGLVTADMFLAQVQRLTADPDWPPAQRLHLTDMSTVTLHSSMDEATIEKAAHLYGAHPDKILGMRIAIVVPEAHAEAGVFERVLTPYGATICRFNLLNIACAWLGLDFNRIRSEVHQLHSQSDASGGSPRDHGGTPTA